uniref:Secreted protein n=1 Tax=Junco hyemalis TaxID=40217 RepID=A0A8C5IJK7_JUNHY
MGTWPHCFLGVLFPLLVRGIEVGLFPGPVGRASAQLPLTVGRQAVLLLLVLLRGRRLRRRRLRLLAFVGGGRRPGVVGAASPLAGLRAQLRGGGTVVTALVVAPRFPVQDAAEVGVIVFLAPSGRAAHQPGKVLLLVGAPAGRAVGPAPLRVRQRLAAGPAALAVVFLHGAVLAGQGPAAPAVRLGALEAPQLLAVRPPRPLRLLPVGLGKGRQLVHGHGRHAHREALTGQHLRLGSLLAATGRR